MAYEKKVSMKTRIFNWFVQLEFVQKNILKAVRHDEGLAEKLLQEKVLINKAASSENFVQKLVYSENNIVLQKELVSNKFISQNEKLISEILSNRKVCNNKRLMAELLKNDVAVDSFLANADFREKLMCNEAFLKKAIMNKTFMHKVVQTPKLYKYKPQVQARVCQFIKIWSEFLPWLSPSIAESDKYDVAIEAMIIEKQSAEMLILEAASSDSIIHLNNADLEFSNLSTLKIQFQELLLHEDYYFETKEKNPRILDCGANFGLAVYYFNQLYPDCSIIAFEPEISMREMLKRNVERNRWENVTILPYALDDNMEDKTFYVPKNSFMAGSLTTRRKDVEKDVESYKVQTRCLSEYLQEPVNYLKLDIEGVELEVLQESRHLLKNVEYIFCEYHTGANMPPDRLEKILRILDEENFVIQLDKSYVNKVRSQHRPMQQVETYSSSVIWAKNRCFNVSQ